MRNPHAVRKNGFNLLMESSKDFIGVYRLYRRAHGRRYALTRAWEIAFRGIPF